MELSRTINSDKRYYLDENTIENAVSFLQTMRVFNDAKIDLYNALYDQKYLASGPLIDHAYPVFLKEKYKTNDYYNAAVYSAVSGSISSQKGLMIVLFNKTIVKLDEYERSVESDIRKLKTRLALITEARKRKEKKLENIKNLPPERMESSSDTSGGVVQESDKFKFVKIKRIKK